MGGALAAAVVLCGTGIVAANAAPTAIASPGFTDVLLDPTSGIFTPAGLDAGSAKRFQQAAVASRGKFRFTPAGVNQARSRILTVAVRASGDERSARAVSVRNVIAASGAGVRSQPSESGVTIKPTKYELGSAKGWTSFALPTESRKSDVPSITPLGTGASYRLDQSDKPDKRSRFNTRVTLESPDNGRAVQRKIAGSNDYALDVGGSYSITKGVDVTAGVRYKSEQEAPLADQQRDSQAVYLGTLIRF